jgi:hypothetical protein
MIDPLRALVEQWRDSADHEYNHGDRGFASGCDQCANELERELDALLSAPVGSPRINCPACGTSVVQVASATLDLALWQHWNWACPKREAAPVGSSPPPSWKFFVDGRPYETTYPALNSMEIKHKAGVPADHRLGYGILRRFIAGEQKLFLSDEEPIDLTGELKEFYSVPHAYPSGSEASAPEVSPALEQERCESIRDGRRCTRLRYHDASMNATPHLWEAVAPSGRCAICGGRWPCE